MRFVLLLVLLAASGCDLLDGASPASFDDIPEGLHLQVLPASGVHTFSDAAAWAAFWEQHAGSVPDDPPPVPLVDFEQQAVVVVAADTRSGCERGLPLVRSARRARGAITLYVDARGTVVGPCDMVIRPVQAVAIERGLQIHVTGTF